MRMILFSWLIMSVAVFLTAYLLPGVSVESFFAAIVVALVLGIINTFFKPILILLTFPITIVTLGLFSLVLNALLIMVTGAIVPDFTVENFWWALLFSVVLSLINGFLGKMRPKAQSPGPRAF